MVGRLVVACIAVAMILAGLFTSHWWTMKLGGLGVDGPSWQLGLRGGTGCLGTICADIAYDDRSGVFGAMLFATFWGGLIAVVWLAVGIAIRELRGAPRQARLAGGGCVVAMLVCMATIAVGAFTSGAMNRAMPSYSGALAVIGFFLGNYAARLGTSDGAGSIGADGSQHARALDARLATERAALQRSLDLAARTREATRAQPASTKRSQRAAKGVSSIADASIDAVRDAMRFVARSIEIRDSSLIATAPDGGHIELAWHEVARIVARRLPPDPPFDKIVFVDLVRSADRTPVRILPSTMGNYAALPGAASIRAIDNLRKLGAAIAAGRHEVIEPESAAFFLAGKEPSSFPSIKLFAAYDEQYG